MKQLGRADIPLTEQGQQDARKLGERLCAVRFTHVFTSPLQRHGEHVNWPGWVKLQKSNRTWQDGTIARTRDSAQ